MSLDKDAYYFPHFSNARNDRKLRRLRKELGIEGYGIFFMVLEILREEESFSYPIADIDLLADEFNTSEQKVKVVVLNYDLFEIDENERFFSPKLILFMQPYLEAKTRNRISGIKGNLLRWGYATKEELDRMDDQEILRLNSQKQGLLGGESGGDRKKSKVKQSKVNQKKGENLIWEETIYNLYPRKVAKQKAIDSIIKALDQISFLDLKKKVQLYASSVKGQDPKFIPYPASWFNQKRWEDDPKEWRAWRTTQKQTNDTDQQIINGGTW